jgi:hypothetical protein
MPHPVFFLLLAALSLSGCVSRPLSLTQPPQQTILSADRVALPTTFFNGCPYVDLMINRKGPYRFLVDTGADAMVITRRVAREARISFSRKHVAQNFGASGEFEMQWMGWINRIESSLFLLRGVSTSIAGPKTPYFDQKIRDAYFGGILGISTLHDLVLEIDYPERKVSVTRVGSTTLSAESGIPFTGPRPLVTITTPSAKYPTVSTTIDTGSEGGI